MMDVGFTGTRPPEHFGAAPFTVAELELIAGQVEDLPRGTKVRTGACIGVDEIVMDVAWRRGLYVVSYVPGRAPGARWTTPMLSAWSHEVIFTGKDPLARNHDIVDASEQMRAIALYEGDQDPDRQNRWHSRSQPRSGTWATVRMAVAANKLERLIMLRPRPAGSPPRVLSWVVAA